MRDRCFRLRTSVAGLLAAGLLAACAGAPPTVPAPPPAAVIGALEIHQPRASLVPGTGAVYLTVINTGSGEDRLLRAESASARIAETHETIAEGAVMRMIAHPEGFAVPSSGRLELAPGGKHIMLIEPRVTGPEQDTLPVTLYFARAGTVTLDVPLLAAGAMP